MNELVSDGVGLMVMGMGVVFLFLVVLIFATGCMSALINQFFPENIVATTNSSPNTAVANHPVDPQIAAAITAAIHQHRNK